MKYPKIKSGIFLDRPNRFIAHVQLDDSKNTVETVHVKNTGRCKELLVPGCKVILEDCSQNPLRKTAYDLIAVYKNCGDEYCKNLLINMDSQAPNKVVLEWLQNQNYSLIKPEYTFGNSRVDFYMEKQLPDGKIQKYLMEVKGCTLEIDGIGYFPDAPTQRGVKHLHELAFAAQQGYKCFLTFVIQVPGVTKVLPNTKTHPEFATALEQAKASGVQILYLCCDVKEDELKII